ncbi:MAG: ATP-binding protein [Elusimicrobia bacterium]|nr:ATP-binding protein [Elusimicrobiota bacterium]
MFVKRDGLINEIKESLRRNPVTALLGPRQCGKTTVAKLVSEKFESEYFDLENPTDAAKLRTPQIIFDNTKGIIILDEIQRKPELLPIIRVFADRKPLKLRFLVLGSASPELIKKSSESLAGRVHFIEMSGFSIHETGIDKINKLWIRGGFPKSFLAKNDDESMTWRYDFIKTFLERDIFQLGMNIPSATLRRFWSMVSHYHGQIWNASEIGNSMGVSHITARKYIDILSGTFMVRQLMPFFANIGKRIIKSPKIFIRDSGILHSLLGISTYKALLGYPKLGASWEGFALEQILKKFGDRDSYFWGTHAGAELDLLLIRNRRRYGFEFKFSDAPVLTKSMQIATKDLSLKHLWIIYPGKEKYYLNKRCLCIPLDDLDSIEI